VFPYKKRALHFTAHHKSILNPQEKDEYLFDKKNV